MDIEQKITLMLKTNQYDWIALGLQLARQNLTHKQVFRLVYKVIEDILWECEWQLENYTIYHVWTYSKNIFGLIVVFQMTVPGAFTEHSYLTVYRRKMKFINNRTEYRHHDIISLPIYTSLENRFANLHRFISQQTTLILKRFK